MKTVHWVALVLAGCLLVGCGGDDESTSMFAHKKLPSELGLVALATNGYEAPEAAGILTAREHGYFESVGLEVVPSSPANPSGPIRYVLSDFADLAISHMPQVVMSRARGKPVVAVASLISRPTAAMIWLQGASIKGISDLKGRTIGLAGPPFEKEFLKVVLSRAGLQLGDVKIKFLLYGTVRALTDGKTDAIFGGSANLEGAELRARGLDPVVTPVRDAGVPPYDELVIVATRADLDRRPQKIRRFLAAVFRGTSLAVRSTRRAAEAVESGPDPDPDATPSGVRLGVEATLPLLSRNGYMNPEKTKSLIDWMYGERMIRNKPRVRSLLTNRYLPSR